MMRLIDAEELGSSLYFESKKVGTFDFKEIQKRIDEMPALNDSVAWHTKWDEMPEDGTMCIVAEERSVPVGGHHYKYHVAVYSSNKSKGEGFYICEDYAPASRKSNCYYWAPITSPRVE